MGFVGWVCLFCEGFFGFAGIGFFGLMVCFSGLALLGSVWW